MVDDARWPALCEAVFRSAPTGLVVYDAAGELLAVNSAALEILGQLGDDPSEFRLCELMEPTDCEADARLLDDLLSGRVRSYTVEMRIRRPDGDPVWVRLIVSLAEDASRGPIVVRVVEDITTQKEIRTALRASEDRARQAQKMEAIGRLAGEVAHDFNNLLTVIRGNAQLAREGATGEDAELLAEILDASRRAGDLTRKLLTFSRRDAEALRLVDMCAVVRQLGSVVRRLVPESVQVDVETADRPAFAYIDDGQIEHVILNLVVNAVDAMPDGGRLAIEVRPTVLDTPVTSLETDLDTGDYVELTVTDTGCGIDPETRPRIFEPFFTTKERGKGTGLGLATVFATAKRHDGGVLVESTPGLGTCMRVLIPQPRVTGGEGEDGGASTGSTILVVEDDPSVRRLAVRVLKARGYRVLESSEGERAVELARAHHDSLDLVLCDLVLPDATGPEIAARMEAEGLSIPITFMSGYTREVVLPRGIRASRERILQKPFTPAELLARVGRALGSSPP